MLQDVPPPSDRLFDHRPAVGAALDGGESSERARLGTPQGEAGGRRTRRIASSLAARSVNDQEVARPSTGTAGYELRRTHANGDSAEPASGHASDQDGVATSMVLSDAKKVVEDIVKSVE
jgi:hypothetical protein